MANIEKFKEGVRTFINILSQKKESEMFHRDGTEDSDVREAMATTECFFAIKNVSPDAGEDGLEAGRECIYYEMNTILHCLIIKRYISTDGDISRPRLNYELKVIEPIAPKDADEIFEPGYIFQINRRLDLNSPDQIEFLNLVSWSMVPLPK